MPRSQKPNDIADIKDQAVLSYRVEQLERATTEGFALVNQKLDRISKRFATKDELLDHVRDVESDMSSMTMRMDKLESRRWIQNTLSAILGSIMTFLLMYFLNNITVGKP